MGLLFPKSVGIYFVLFAVAENPDLTAGVVPNKYALPDNNEVNAGNELHKEQQDLEVPETENKGEKDFIIIIISIVIIIIPKL